MGNCLIKKLQTTVKDENLSKLGEISLNIYGKAEYLTNINLTVKFDSGEKNYITDNSGYKDITNKLIDLSNYISYRYYNNKLLDYGFTEENQLKLNIFNKYFINEIVIEGSGCNMINDGLDKSLEYTKLKYLRITNAIKKNNFNLENIDTSELINFSESNNNFNVSYEYIATKCPKLLNFASWSTILYWPSITFRPYEYSIFGISLNNAGTNGIRYNNPDYVDNLLINLSKCTYIEHTSVGDEYVGGKAKFICLNKYGGYTGASRTTASNQAIKDLINLGYTIKIDGVEQTGNETFE